MKFHIISVWQCIQHWQFFFVTIYFSIFIQAIHFCPMVRLYSREPIEWLHGVEHKLLWKHFWKEMLLKIKCEFFKYMIDFWQLNVIWLLDICRKAFRDELALLQKVRHPNVVQFLGAVTQSSPMMIVTEYLPKVYIMKLFCIMILMIPRWFFLLKFVSYVYCIYLC